MDKEEKKTRKEIRKAVEKELKPFGAIRRKTVEGLCASAYDAYLSQTELGTPKSEALATALGSMKETVVERYGAKKYNPFWYSLFFSSLSLIATIGVAIYGSVNDGVKFAFGNVYPIYFLITLTYFIYTVATYKKRHVLDFVIGSVLFVSVLAITIQCVKYFYRPMTGDFFWELHYHFPGLLRFCLYWFTSTDMTSYEWGRTIFLFDPTFLASLACFCVCVVMFFKEWRKYAKRNIN